MKAIIYWSAYVLILLGILICSLVSVFGCNSERTFEATEIISIQHPNIDSLSNVADSAVNEVQNTLYNLDKNVRNKDKTIEKQLRDLEEKSRNLLELEKIVEDKRQEALIAEENANNKILEMEEMRTEFLSEIDKMYGDFTFAVDSIEGGFNEEICQSIEKMVVVLLQNNLSSLIYDENTGIWELTKELPEGRLNWLIENTPVVNKRIKQGK